jgi:hypothetical protein
MIIIQPINFMIKSIHKSRSREHVLYEVLSVGYITELHETIG